MVEEESRPPKSADADKSSAKKPSDKKAASKEVSRQQVLPNRQHFLLSVRRELENVRIFTARRWPRAERPEYADLYCANCGGLDGPAALRRGVSQKVVIRSDVDWATTSDEATIVSANVRHVLEQATKDELEFFPLQDAKHFVLWVNRTLAIPPGQTFLGNGIPKALLYSNTGRCSDCGRLQNCYMRPYEYDYSAVPNVVGLQMSTSALPARFFLVMHDHVGEKLKAAGVKGWRRTSIDDLRKVRASFD